MGFFELPERDPEEDDLEPDQPDDLPRTAPWTAGVVPLELVVARSAEAAVLASRVAAYPDGFELTLDSHVRPTVPRRRRQRWYGSMWDPNVAPDDPVPDTLLRFGLAWPDGGRATNLDRWGRGWAHDATEPTHGLDEQGGGGSDSAYTQHYWCWPLPTEGELRVIVEWPAFGIPETSTTIDATLLAEAATRARPVWEDDADVPAHLSRTALLRAVRLRES